MNVVNTAVTNITNISSTVINNINSVTETVVFPTTTSGGGRGGETSTQTTTQQQRVAATQTSTNNFGKGGETPDVLPDTGDGRDETSNFIAAAGVALPLVTLSALLRRHRKIQTTSL